MNHIKEVHFNSKRQHFFTARKFKDKLYTRLGLKAMDVTNGKEYPDDSIVAYKPDEGSPSTITVYVALEDKDTHIVETLSKEKAIKYFEDQLQKKRDQLEDILESKRPVVRQKAEGEEKPKTLNTRRKAA